MRDKKKTIILSSVILGVLVVVLSFSYALFTYDRVGTSGNLVLGDIYFHYRETDKFINIQNAMPRKLIADDFVSSKKVLNPIMKNQTLMTAEDLEGNELTKCVNYMTMIYMKVQLGDYYGDYKQFCQGGTLGDVTLEEAISLGVFPEIYIEEMESLNIVINNDDTHQRNTIMDIQILDESQSINSLSMCFSLFEIFRVGGLFEFQEGETSEAFCRGTGTILGMSFNEHIRQETEVISEIDMFAVFVEELKDLTLSDKTLLDVDLPYFEFTIDGKNTYEDKNIEYEIVLNNSEYNGEDKETRTERIDNKFLKFALVELVDGEASIKFYNKSVYDLENTTIFTDSISSDDGAVNTTYRLYMWIGDEVVVGSGDVDYDYDLETWNNKIYASVRVDINANFVPKTESEIDYEPAVDSPTFKRLMNNEFQNNIYVDIDGTVYLRGNNNEVIYNYVWYSGKLWRIVAINPDGSLKLITENSISALAWGVDNTYDTSYIRQWLNQEFLPTLYDYENIIKLDSKWDITSSSSETPIKVSNPNLVEVPVGLLTAYEISLISSNSIVGDGNNLSYLNIYEYWHLITPDDNSGMWYVDSYGNLYNGDDTNSSLAVRPVINLKFDVKFTGSGTKEEPYKIIGDIGEATFNTTLLNTRISGEYVKLENDSQNRVFRIVDNELVNGNLTTKLVLNDYVKETGSVLIKSFSNSTNLWSNVSSTDATYWRGYLNTTWLGTLDANMLEKGIYYLGDYDEESYKTTVCSTISNQISISECIKSGNIVSNVVRDDYVGVLRVGEIFGIQIPGLFKKTNVYLISPKKSSTDLNWMVHSYNNLWTSYSNGTHSVRPSINLKSEIVIKSGTGTEQDPFVVGFAS